MFVSMALLQCINTTLKTILNTLNVFANQAFGVVIDHIFGHVYIAVTRTSPS